MTKVADLERELAQLDQTIATRRSIEEQMSAEAERIAETGDEAATEDADSKLFAFVMTSVRMEEQRSDLANRLREARRTLQRA